MGEAKRLPITGEGVGIRWTAPVALETRIRIPGNLGMTPKMTANQLPHQFGAARLRIHTKSTSRFMG